MNDLLPYLQGIAALATAGSLIFAAITYYKNNKVKRGEWLKALFEKFFEDNKFSEVRMHLEYDTIEQYLAVNVNRDPTDKKNEELMVNYLNFFEFISVLNIKKYITDEEVKLMFRYYVKKIREDKYLNEVKYLETYDFENLIMLMNKKYE